MNKFIIVLVMADKVTLTPANFVSSTYPPITLFYFLF